MAAQIKLLCLGKSVKLKADQLIKRGGEGAVYRHGQWAIKLYDKPDDGRTKRLQGWLQQAQQLSLPKKFIVPEAVVSNEQREVVGYRMPLLPPQTIPLKALTQPQANRLPYWSLQKTVKILQTIWSDLELLHRQGIVVGDLSDHNIYVDLTPETPLVYWIDTDSYQFANFACQVMQPAFAAPWINSAARPQFTTASDIYAYHVLICKMLLWVHPYGGVHKKWKSLLERQSQGCWLLATGVTYPRLAQPHELLSAELQDYLEYLFTSPARNNFSGKQIPAALTNFIASLCCCPQCDATYSRTRSTCPYCQARFAKTTQASLVNRRWLLPPGNYEALLDVSLEAETGRLRLICYNDGEYQLLTGGIGGHFQCVPLFKGGPGYQFGRFGRHLLVQPHGAQKQLLFDVSGSKPRLLDQLSFPRDTQNVWTTTGSALYRRTGEYLNRGIESHGYFVEEIAFPVRPAHLTLWASPWNDQLIGLERQFQHSCFFVWQRDKGTGRSSYHELQLPPGWGHNSKEVAVSFAKETLLLSQRRSQGNSMILENSLFAANGHCLGVWSQPDNQTASATQLAHGCWQDGAFWLPVQDQIRKMNATTDTTFQLEEGLVEPGVKLLGHPAGLLIHHPDALAFLARS